jgi:hypothetical protein
VEHLEYGSRGRDPPARWSSMRPSITTSSPTAVDDMSSTGAA